MSAEVPRPRTKPASSRVSLACVPCRNRHIKCDATRPYCRRCSNNGNGCFYEKSRRGGLDREALAARRAREAGGGASSGSSGLAGSPASRDELSDIGEGARAMETWAPILTDGSTSRSEQRETAALPAQPPPSFDTSRSLYVSSEPVADPLIDLYFEHFHGFHPCVLPRRHLQMFLRDQSRRASLEPLISVIRFLGSIYDRSGETPWLKEHARRCNSDSQLPVDPLARAFLAQARLLLAIGLYWSTDMEESRSVIDRAICDAFDLGMHRREFAAENGGGDPVLEESWRRTWWQIYTVDAYYAAIKRSTRFLAQEMESTVDLPCEESEYEAGSIKPRTLEDFENREFAPDDHVFSSFAYLVGAVRCIASATAVAPQETSPNVSAKVVGEVDAIVDGWFLLLPESKRQVMRKDGTIDELMFQAHMGLHASIIGLHRPYSNLLFNPLEIISSCSTGPPDSVHVGELVNVHTIRCLKSVEAQIRLMALPTRPFCHTPFVICMVTAGTIPLLSACKFLFASERLEIARHQIRMSIGCLKAMAGIWPQAAVHVREIQTIAQEVLGILSRAPVALENGSDDRVDRARSVSSTVIGHFDIQPSGSFPADSMGDGFQQAWDSMQPDLTCYDFTAFNQAVQ